MVKDDNIRITVTIPKRLHERLLSDAEYEDRSLSNFVAKILKEYYQIKIDD